MKKRFITCLAAVLCTVLALSAAGADAITLSGQMIPAETIRVYAPVSGAVESVAAEEGRKIRAEDTIYTMRTTKIYADHDGKVSGIFGQPGDDAETVAARYGAVLYLEEAPAYTVSASTSNAYNSLETKQVHTGETVYAVSRSNSARCGKGVITAISGSSYSVEITEGVFLSGESVALFRNEEYDYEQKIGTGTVTLSDPAAITGTGAIVSIAVEDGAEVKRGDLLMETLDGTYDAYVMTGTEITAGQAGVIGSVSVQAGSTVEKGAVAAEIYPLDRMRVEANIPEDYCNMISEGDPVTVELATDINRHYSGTVVMISAIASEDEEEVTYRIVAEFVPDEAVRFGMSALITAGEEEPARQEEKAEKTEDTPAEAETTEESGKKEHRERPEGMPEWNGEGERPERPEGGWPERPSGTSGETTEATETEAQGDANP